MAKDPDYALAAVERLLNERGFTNQQQLEICTRLCGVKLVQIGKSSIDMNINDRFVVSSSVEIIEGES